jgi:hypothetical protein
MGSYTFTYSGSVTPKAKKYVQSQELSMDFSGTIDLDDNDGAKLKTIQKEFDKLMKKAIENQLGFLNQWISERDKVIDDMVSKFDKMKASFPDTPQSAQEHVNRIKELAVLGLKIEQYPKEYEQIVKNWAENCKEQQGLIAVTGQIKTSH